MLSLALQALLPRDDPTSQADPVSCDTGNGYDGRMGLRISSVFVILVGSTLGAWFPVFAKRHKSMGVPAWSFFIAKFFGSGVIIATAFIHLLSPAHDALTNPCLTGPITEYSWVEGIVLMTIMVMFVIELMTMRYVNFGDGHGHGHDHGGVRAPSPSHTSDPKTLDHSPERALTSQAPGTDHLGHSRDHVANSDIDLDWEERGSMPESYAAQVTAVFILEFGVVFHSIFVGLTLAVAGTEFITLYIVLVFHQTFEGLGLGSRLASIPWPESKKWTPYVMAIGYGLATPIAIAIGLGVRTTYPPESRTTLLVNGVFDSISAGILIYTGLIELLAHEFMFSPSMQRAKISEVLSAVGLMWLGAALMALLGKWA